MSEEGFEFRMERWQERLELERNTHKAREDLYLRRIKELEDQQCFFCKWLKKIRWRFRWRFRWRRKWAN